MPHIHHSLTNLWPNGSFVYFFFWFFFWFFFGPKGSFYIIELIILWKPSGEQQGLLIDLNGLNKSSAEQQDFILVDNGRLF